MTKVAADDEKVLGVGEKGGKSGCALLQHTAPDIADHDRHQLNTGIEHCSDKRVVKFEADDCG